MPVWQYVLRQYLLLQWTKLCEWAVLYARAVGVWWGYMGESVGQSVGWEYMGSWGGEP